MPTIRSIPVLALTVLVLVTAVAPASAQGRRSGQRPARPGPTVLDRLEQMTPEERQKALERLPRQRRQRIEQRLREYERLSPGERERLRQRYDRFRALSPERQEAVRSLFHRFREMPPDRRLAVRQAVRRLSILDDAARRARMDSPEFRGRYSPEEREMVRDFVELTPEP